MQKLLISFKPHKEACDCETGNVFEKEKDLNSK